MSDSTVKDSSVVAVQIFDQRKFKRRDQGFLGVVNVRVSDVLDLELDGHGTYSRLIPLRLMSFTILRYFRDAYAGPQTIQ